VRSAASDPGVFVRSMAARERLGGIAEATRSGVAILAAVFDHVFVETVGVGQSESEVVSIVDTLLFVATPGGGDVLQFIKAGLVELPDVFAVNKSDLGEAAIRTAHELETAQGMAGHESGGWRPPVLQVSARDGTGVDALLDALGRHFRHQSASGALRARRRAGAEESIQSSLALRYGSYGLERLGGADAVRARLREAPGAAWSSFAFVDALGAEIEDALKKAR
jgi:LAO/AO transport system kinase